MHFRALAADYDGTIAHHGAVDADTMAALGRLKESGRCLVLVTGREMADLRHAFPETALFDRIVAENGGVLHNPATGRERALAPAPPGSFVRRLMELEVEPISVGHTIVATWLPHDKAVLGAIEELGLELQIIFNKGAVMVLPAGVNKASGLAAALDELALSAVNVVAVGDAENDHAFLRSCGCSAAVGNALPAVKEASDIVLSRDHGAGVVELIDRILREDVDLLPRQRLGVLLGDERDGEAAYLRPEESLLIAGGSGSGKSRFVTLLTERMIEKRQEFCLIDPEGDYETLEGAIVIGDEQLPPSIDEAVRLLRRRDFNIVVSTLALDLPARHRFFERLLPAVLELRARTGRPHWLIVDEAHHFLPRMEGEASPSLGCDFSGCVLVSVDPKWLTPAVLRQFDHLLAFGAAAPGWWRTWRARPGSRNRTCRTARRMRGCSGRSGRRAGAARSRSAPRGRTTSATAASTPSAMSATNTASISATTAGKASAGRATSPTSSAWQGVSTIRSGTPICARATSRRGSGTSSETRSSRGGRRRRPTIRISILARAAGGSSTRSGSAT
jgi:HAD superfamily hydrolase (TIGR01484 family)